MAYQTASFGSADGSNVEGTVTAHYGPYVVGNAEGVYRTAGVDNEMVVNFDGDTIDLPVPFPKNSVVTDVVTDFATGAITTLEAGSVDISGADGTTANKVSLPDGGLLTAEGPTAGYIIIRYMNVADA